MRRFLSILLIMTASTVVLAPTPTHADWGPADGHKMHFPQLPDLRGVDVFFNQPKILADDWRCSQSGPVEDIHFWFSAKGDWLEPGAPWDQQIFNIHLSIHENIPDPDGPGPLYSMPGRLLWQRDLPGSAATFVVFDQGLQDWWNPNTGEYQVGDHQMVYLCNIRDIPDPFHQKQGEIYWLDITVDAAGPLGWKSSDRLSYPDPYTGGHYEDDAVWTDDFGGGAWNEMRYPFGEYAGQSMDLAFVVNGDTTIWDHKMHFPQLPDYEGVDVYFDPPKILADDWMCSLTGTVDDIHFWFSAKDDWLDISGDLSEQIFNIHVSIHENIPDPDGTGPLYSMPGVLLWERDYPVSDVAISQFATGFQDWYNPNTGEYLVDNHMTMYRCDITRITDPFVQYEGEIYWLDITIDAADSLGWKAADLLRYPPPNTGTHFEDDAVWTDDPGAAVPWHELVYPYGQFEGQSMDLAFVITGDTLPEVGWNHKMHFPQLPDADGVDIRFLEPKTLADDWRCTQTGPVEDIHFWFSAQQDWFNINEPLPEQIHNIHVSIHDNIPDPDGQGPLYSMPGNLLWQADYPVDLVNIVEDGAGVQDWWDPNTGEYVIADHTKYYRVDIDVGEIFSQFYQKRGRIYWLDVTLASTLPLGWKTADRDRYPDPYTGTHFEDDAVWTDEPAGGIWNELIFPYGPDEGESVDLSFVITGDTTTWKHKMHFPQLPDIEGADVNFKSPYVLADDWKCSQTGRVTDVHFWFSAKGDWLNIHGDLADQIHNIHLSIHANIPDPDGPGSEYSKPGDLLWERDVPVDSVTIVEYVTAGQDWQDPYSGEYIVGDHRNMYRCDILLDPAPYYFYQRQDSIYWLDISIDSEGELGWKTADFDRYPDPYTGDHFEDDAVSADVVSPGWNELIFFGGPNQGRSIDLAFVITGDSVLTGVDSDEGGVPQSYRLLQNYPNPFNPNTTIRYELPQQSKVHLAVYNIRGQLVRVLFDGSRPLGPHEVTWDGKDASGTLVASGVYFYRLTAGTFVQTKKMVLLK
jgi:hypothetical protein